jgi:hypothetical protein
MAPPYVSRRVRELRINIPLYTTLDPPNQDKLVGNGLGFPYRGSPEKALSHPAGSLIVQNTSTLLGNEHIYNISDRKG